MLVGFIDGGLRTDSIVIYKICGGMLEDDEFMFVIVIVLITLLNVQVGIFTTEIPTNLAQVVGKVGITVLGKTIWIIPEEYNPSVIATFIWYVVTLFTVNKTTATLPVKVDATAWIVPEPTILSYPFLIILTVIELDILVEGGNFIW